MSNILYDQDFFAWANKQAQLLRSGKLTEANIDHIAEKIDGLSRAEKRELISRLSVLLLHWLKWQYQPVRRGSSCVVTPRNQCRALADRLVDNPSLKAKCAKAVARAYGDARGEAYAESGLPEGIFPATCDWTFDQIMAPDF